MKKVLLILLVLFSLIYAQTGPVPTAGRGDPATILLEQFYLALTLLVPLMIVLVVLAAMVYAVGQLFGAETRARATVWAKSMLSAVGVAIALTIVLFIVLGTPPGPVTDPIENTIEELASLAQTALVALIFFLVVLSALTYALGQMAGAETRARATVWATGMLAGALVAAVIYVIFFQILSSFQLTFFEGTILKDYAQVIISVAFLVTAIILITYLITKVFQVPEWEAYLSIELSNLAGSFLIIIFVLAFFGAGEIFSILVTGETHGLPRASIKFLTEKVANNVMEGMYDTFRIQTCSSMLSSFSRRTGEAVLTNVFKVFPGMDVFVNITNVIGYGLVAIYGSVQAQITALHLVDSTMVLFFLPAGLVLRFFPPTRDAGSFLIALAFAFQFVFPLIYIMNAEVLEELEIKPYEDQKSEVLIQSLCGPFKYGVFGVLFNPGQVPFMSHFPRITTLFRTLLSETTLNLVSMAEFIPIMRSLSVLSLFALFIPAFALVITMSFINAMTKFLTTKL
jgi:hypothetical protein